MNKNLVVSLSVALAATSIALATDSTTPNLDLATTVSCTGNATRTVNQLAQDAVSENKAVAENAIHALRTRGPEGLRALLEAHAEALNAHNANRILATTKPPDNAWLRLKAALDGVSQQRDCYASKLYWFTDFEQAKAAAKASAKPILSLRLLGKLNEEFSCANSRFFRTTLYANKEISEYLRNYFVLHWKSVRPVPKVTIDFGDGRKLERTITGNSIHYVLDSEGRVIDALPGLYGPQVFLRELGRAEEIARQSTSLASDEREQLLVDYHRSRVAALKAAYADDLQTVSANGTSNIETFAVRPVTRTSAPPTAQVAGRLAVGKHLVEMPILKATSSIGETVKNQSQPAPLSEDEIWKRIAALHADGARLDNSSKTFMRSKHLTAFDAGRLAMAKSVTEDPLLRAVRNLEYSIAEDTVRNEYLFHTKIHEWLANGTAPRELDALNSKVYAELFLTPDSDPWLGLLPRDTYAALENDGMTLSTQPLNFEITKRFQP